MDHFFTLRNGFSTLQLHESQEIVGQTPQFERISAILVMNHMLSLLQRLVG